MNELYEKISKKYPFLSYLKSGDKEFIGIVQNKDATVTSFYDFEKLNSTELKEKFIELGEAWWWESNRMIPINIFLKSEWAIFRFCLVTLNSKDCEIVDGPYVSLSEISQKRTKKRSIQLIKKMP